MNAAWIALSLVVGAKRLRELISHFNNDLEAILKADDAALQQVRGIGPKLSAAIRAADVAAVERMLPRWADVGIRALTLYDPDYPPALRRLDDAPPTLFIQGNNTPARRVAVVGTRSPTPTARDDAERIGFELASRGCTVVSGLAVGIDTAAHMGALAAPNGTTWAVLGCGLLNPYPPENRKLAGAIARRGLLLSEAHPAAEPSVPLLVARNRIISGLCEAVIVVETSVDGGAMHAARRAREQGRLVYTLDSDASGNRALIAEGAAVVTRELKGVFG